MRAWHRLAGAALAAGLVAPAKEWVRIPNPGGKLYSIVARYDRGAPPGPPYS